jgi:hypothetical protein
MRALRAQKRPVEALNGPFQPDSVPVICRSSPFAEFFITLLAAILFPVFAQAREKARQARSVMKNSATRLNSQITGTEPGKMTHWEPLQVVFEP